MTKNPSYYYQKIFGKEKASRSTESTEPPYIETLNLTRVTLQSVDRDVPNIPPQARRVDYSTMAPRTTTRHTKRDEYEGHENIGDIESAIPAPWN